MTNTVLLNTDSTPFVICNLYHVLRVNSCSVSLFFNVLLLILFWYMFTFIFVQCNVYFGSKVSHVRL